MKKSGLMEIKIIIAEDNELNMEIARFIIEGAGAQVMPAVNGEEAVKIFETSKYGDVTRLFSWML